MIFISLGTLFQLAQGANSDSLEISWTWLKLISSETLHPHNTAESTARRQHVAEKNAPGARARQTSAPTLARASDSVSPNRPREGHRAQHGNKEDIRWPGHEPWHTVGTQRLWVRARLLLSGRFGPRAQRSTWWQRWHVGTVPLLDPHSCIQNGHSDHAACRQRLREAHSQYTKSLETVTVAQASLSL